MYSTCIFCHASLGTNEVVEHFPVGRRLAFDAARGRLWAVCRKCERWNLSPVEERWEAIEECERLFADTRLRVSTDNIGLARVREGLELVRIGSPMRPEMAAWRYGDQFGRRRTRRRVYTGLGIAAALGLVVVGPMTGVVAGSGWGLWNLASSANTAFQARRVRARVALPGRDAPVPVRLRQLSRASILRQDDGWALHLAFEAQAPGGSFDQRLRWWLRFQPEESAFLTGDAALQAAAKLLPSVNAAGATKQQVESAVRVMSETADPAALFDRYSQPSTILRNSFARKHDAPGRQLGTLAPAVRLALEMATHEDAERRALEGELALLEAEWEQAEEIAAIADDLFVPDETDARLEELRKRSDPDG